MRRWSTCPAASRCPALHYYLPGLCFVLPSVSSRHDPAASNTVGVLEAHTCAPM